MFNWYRQVSARERKTFWACFSGWALDALDVQVFTLAIPALIAAFGLDKGQAGMVGAATLVSSALGGWVIGAVSDRLGRVRTLQLTIVWFSLFTFLCAFAQTFPQLIVLKALQGFGFGGEWAAGAVLMAESVRSEHRGKAMGTVQSAWAVGWAAAVILYTILFSWLSPDLAWRAMFMLGLLPALLVVYIRRSIPEPAKVAKPVAAPSDGKVALVGIFSPALLKTTLIGSLLGMGAHGGYYALMTWLPTYLGTERHLSVLGTGGYLAVIIAAFWLGCIASAQLLDRIGRRRNVALFAVCSTITVLVYLLLPVGNTAMLFLGFPLGFFAAGIPASLGALFNELYPAAIRGAGVGFCYNFGRIASAGFPLLVGYMSRSMPLGQAIGIDAAIAYGLVVITVLMLPETMGKKLDGAPDAPATHSHPAA
ncbi:MFS transporter [Janthinobacterium agaricidamnosum]|uniref:Sugar (And other) transporter family protein n=1 Tax=Janthinobacterium agaricidamnosum NBRC 102515 = DSM 9628 TaxID=1349767 RepID=W0VAT4_9BURK|nr:MFS transporter [Janthinobacterium agaricidamnosum]CDG84448.1 sugar (and other) transporter family protein [Janthinobacterium agaricidamnosum NBRC 102515 = DSM 9628]